MPQKILDMRMPIDRWTKLYEWLLERGYEHIVFHDYTAKHKRDIHHELQSFNNFPVMFDLHDDYIYTKQISIPNIKKSDMLLLILTFSG